MTAYGLLAIVYLTAIVGIAIMKKLLPEDKIYPIWTVAVCIMLTLFLTWYRN
jgi:hypothetical protein